MGRLLFCSLFTAVVLFLPLSTVVYSDTFTDTFDNPNFTSNNWMDYDGGVQKTWYVPSWSHTMVNGTDLGYHARASGEDLIVAKLADNGVEYDNAGLVIETLVRLDSHPYIYTSENMVGVAFSVSHNTGYTAGIEQDIDGGTDILFSLGIVEGDAIYEMPVDISFETFYKLVVHIDSNMQITAWLFSMDGTLIGRLSMENTLSLERGAVAIYGGPEVTFNNFKINDSGAIPLNRLTKTQVSQLYVSIFGRASEGGGNTYWQSQSDMTTAANIMLNTQVAKDYFGANLNTNQAFIEHIYLNTLNKIIADDPSGINYWVNLLDSGTTRGEAVASLVGVIKEYAPDSRYYNPSDTATIAAYNQFTNRVEISDYMADNVWDTPDDWQTSTAFSHGMVVTDDPATVLSAMIIVNGFTPGPCGAYVAPNVWQQFDCYNLAAIGKTTSDDPFTPSWRLIGGYWQWGRKGPDPSHWHDTNTPHFAHAPTGEGPRETNSVSISGWDIAAAPDDAWSGDFKTANDPCPEGFRVPTLTQWQGVLDNNIPNTVGTWGNSTTNYSLAHFFGSDLMLPAAGFRNLDSGALTYRGFNGRYWSSSENSGYLAWGLYFRSGDAYTTNYDRLFGLSVRCVAE